MLIQDVSKLAVGTKLYHSGSWAWHVTRPKVFTVLHISADVLRVEKMNGKQSLYKLTGCGVSDTKDFLAACTLVTKKGPDKNV